MKSINWARVRANLLKIVQCHPIAGLIIFGAGFLFGTWLWLG